VFFWVLGRDGEMCHFGCYVIGASSHWRHFKFFTPSIPSILACQSFASLALTFFFFFVRNW
jgi:hypothetical protein